MRTDSAATAAGRPPRPGRRPALLAASAAAVAVLAVASLAIGPQRTGLGDVWTAFTGPTGADAEVIVRDIRLPRTTLAVFVGAALAAAGTLIQSLTRNPLAEPGLLGVTAGAGFAITVGAVLGAASQLAQLGLALVGALVASAVVYGVGRTSPLRLVLAGVALTFVLTGVTLAVRLTSTDAFDNYRSWAVGALAGREQLPLAVPLLSIGAGLVGAVLVTRPLAAMMLGDAAARALGARVGLVRTAVLALVTLLTAAATAAAGPISFVGLIVPHLARRVAGGSLGWLMAFTLTIGAALVLVGDVAARLLLPTGEVPVEIVMAFVGGPALIWVVRRYGEVSL